MHGDGFTHASLLAIIWLCLLVFYRNHLSCLGVLRESRDADLPFCCVLDHFFPFEKGCTLNRFTLLDWQSTCVYGRIAPVLQEHLVLGSCDLGQRQRFRGLGTTDNGLSSSNGKANCPVCSALDLVCVVVVVTTIFIVGPTMTSSLMWPRDRANLMQHSFYDK